MPTPSAIPEIPLLAPSEFRIFFVLCKRNPLTLRQIGQELARRDPEFRQGHDTLAPFLQRLVKKGYVSQHAQEGLPPLFQPSIPFDFALRRQFERFLDDCFLTGPAELRALVDVALDRLVGERM